MSIKCPHWKNRYITLHMWALQCDRPSKCLQQAGKSNESVDTSRNSCWMRHHKTRHKQIWFQTRKPFCTTPNCATMLHLTSLGVLILYSLFGIRAVLGQCTFLLLPYLLQSAKLQPCRSPLVTDVTNVDIWRLAQMWPMIYQMFDSFGGTVPPAKMGCPCSRPKSRSWSVHYLRGPQIRKNRIDAVSTFLTWNGKCVGVSKV